MTLKPFLLVGFFSSQILFAYNLPNSDSRKINDENVVFLQKMSRAIAKIASESEKALVYVSIFKNVKTGLPAGYVDPFEFFFGPDYRRQGPGGGGPNGPHGGGGRDGFPGGGGNGPGGRGNAPSERREGGLGSGFFVDLERGYIMTNNHVVQDADEIQLKFANGETQQGSIVGRDQNTDVAIVQVKDKAFNRKGLDQLALGNSDEIQKGDIAIALGAPFGLEASVSFGIVSAVGRGNLDITALGNFIQTDAAINPGNSGGPLLDAYGKVIGVNSAIFSKSGANNGIGFAIPSVLAKKIAEQIINVGKVVRGYVGVGMQPIEDELHKALKLPKDVTGILVSEISEGGPADKAGIKHGDVVIAVAGKNVRTPSDLSNAVGLTAPGTTIDLKVLREGKEKDFKVKIEQRPDDNKLADNSKDKKGKEEFSWGLDLSTVSSALRDKFRFLSKDGLVVTDVKEGSDAERVGIQPGDVVIEVNGKKIREASDFKKQTKNAGDRILIRIERQGRFSFVSLRKSN